MKWFAIGLNDPYTIRYNNSQTIEMNFKNVAITDNEDLEQSTFIIWDRVWKETESKDIARINAILKSVQFL